MKKPPSGPGSPKNGGARSIAVLLCGALLAISGAATGQPAYRVKDINQTLDTTEGAGCYPNSFLSSGDPVYFTAEDRYDAIELWRTDGTAAGTFMFKNFRGYYPYPSDLMDVNGTLFLTADYFLWRSDGTPAGTTIVSGTSGPPLNPIWVTKLGGVLYFTAAADSNSYGLWRSDGTTDGTYVIKDLEAQFTTPAGSLIYFMRDFYGPNPELWRSDGTPGGTFPVKAGYANHLTGSGDFLYFVVNDGSHGEELWRSDGTAAGTVLVKDINPGLGSSYPESLTDVNGTLYFSAYDRLHGRELWKSDGTESGTVLVSDIRPGTESSGPVYLTAVDGGLFFVADDGVHGQELWKSDGSSAGTRLVKDINPGIGGTQLGGFARAGTSLFFWADPGTGVRGLWRSDGTEAGTTEIPVGDPEFSVNYEGLGNPNGTVYFGARDSSIPQGDELWKSDGTPEGTIPIKALNPPLGDSNPSDLTDVNGSLFFIASDAAYASELWKSDGTDAGTAVVADLGTGSAADLVNLGGTLLFIRGSNQLWKSDGTPAGTVMVESLTWIYGLTNVGGVVLFGGETPDGQVRLWRTDGTTAGTVVISPPGTCTNPGPPVVANGRIYFFAVDPVLGYGLWSTDGTTAGTVMITAVRAWASITATGNNLFFFVGDDQGNFQLWKSDGTAEGTAFLMTLGNIGDGVPPFPLVAAGSNLYFENFDADHGSELWKSDGTAIGTVLVKDINPGPMDSIWPHSPLTAMDGEIYFAADDGVHGLELWASDGTEEGTRLVSDIWPGPEGSNPASITAVGDSLVFRANDGLSGTELWESNGTESGTRRIQDIWPGQQSSSPGLTDPSGWWMLPGFATSGAYLYFPAADPIAGRELWALPLPALCDFNDVPTGNPFRNFICTLARNGVTAGCGGGDFCPGSSILRNQMSVFVLRALHGSSYQPPPATGTVFSDVTATAFAAAFIEEAGREGIMGAGEDTGCPAGEFCPGDAVTRLSMAYILLRGEHGGGYAPPAANCGAFPFVDVACPSPDADWVSELLAEGITAGCDATHYCPGSPVSRAQMAVFLTTTFGLQ